MAIHVKNLKNHIYDEVVKIREFNLIKIFVIFPQKWQFRLENENFEISRNSAYGDRAPRTGQKFSDISPF